MPNTYEAIATNTLGSAAASVTFSSIPSTYTDLVLVVNGTAGSLVGTFVQFNSDTGSNYSTTYLYGDGSSALSTRASNQNAIQTGNITSGNQCIGIVQVMNYSNTTTNKTVLSRYGNVSNSTGAQVGLWRSTSAINTILVLTNSSTFSTGTTFSLYGIAAA